MIRSLLWYSNFAVSLAFKAPQMLMLKRKKINMSDTEFRKYIHKTTSKWAEKHVRMSGANVQVNGIENIPTDTPVVFMSNHQSNFDIALFMTYVDKPKGYIAKVEMENMPVIKTWMEYMDCVFMDRNDIRKAAKSIIKGVKILKNGHSLVIFPEGTRSKCSQLNEFKAGSFKLATKAGVPIVPVTIDGSYKLMEQNKNKIVPADVRLTIHKSINTSDLSKDDMIALPERVKEIIASEL